MRRRLTLLVAATTCLVLLAFLVPLAVLLRTVAGDRAVGAATADVQVLVSMVGTADPATLRLTVEQVAAASGRPVTVFLPDGTTLGTPVARTSGVALAGRGQSLTVRRADGREILVAVRGRAEGTAVIRTFVTHAELSQGVWRAWLVLAGLGVALLLLGLLVADRLARRLVAPIAELAAVSHRLARAELTARARPAGPPEVRDVAYALNQLAGRIQDLLREERERVADLSHRLRTPLTALRLESESLADPAESARVTAGVDAVERAVTGLIRQARWRGDGDDAACDAVAVVRDRVAFWSVLAEDTGRPVQLDLAPGPLPVRLAADELAAAVDALLGNVFAHTPDGAGFEVTLRSRAGGGAVLTVVDQGPGLPDTLLDPATPPDASNPPNASDPPDASDGRDASDPPGASDGRDASDPPDASDGRDASDPPDASDGLDAFDGRDFSDGWDASDGPVSSDGPAGRIRRGASTAGSTGLGLDIVRRAARGSGGRLAVSNRPAGGARLTVEFGAARRLPATPAQRRAVSGK